MVDVIARATDEQRVSLSTLSTLQVPLPEPSPQTTANQASQQRESLPTTDQILDKYIQALGGAQNLAKLVEKTKAEV